MSELTDRITSLEGQLAEAKALNEAIGYAETQNVARAREAEARCRELEALLADVRRAWYGDGSVVEMARLDAALGSPKETP